MKIFKLGRCHHSSLPAEKHVKNSEINEIILRLWRVKSMPDEPPALRAERKKELESILKNTRRCLDIIINNPAKHNFSKIPRLDRLEEKTYGFILDERAKDYDTESDSEMSAYESESETENDDRPTAHTRRMESEKGKRA
ncbi:MAG: hypothetical protein ACMZI0_02400 [Symbiopectobacterium sp.]|uniref:hypothetical protein n=1 Tax=Symbiopectobacterium sp. TaxID=2952789 RepID=UPI0039E9673B